VDTLPSEVLPAVALAPPWLYPAFAFVPRLDRLPYLLLSVGQRGITPAFGYGAPHLSARGTLTLLDNALLSTRFAYSALALLQDGNVRIGIFPEREKSL